MGLSWRDGIGTLLVAAAVTVTLSVVYGWNWPLIGDARAGVIALFFLSYPSCLVAQAPARMAAAIRHETTWSAFLIVATVLGAVALASMILGVVVNSVAVLIVTTTVVVGIWVVTTAHHLAEPGPRPSLQAGGQEY
jgi:hypothetical protein